MKHETPELLTVVDAARLYGFSRETIYKLIRNGVVVRVPVPGTTAKRLRRAEMDQLFGINGFSKGNAELKNKPKGTRVKTIIKRNK